jgi:SWI/SNF-related matrix-associated actin-dependent regulator 1 of chromatin subfamily A
MKKRTAKLVKTTNGQEKIMIEFPYKAEDINLIRTFDNRRYKSIGQTKFWIADISLGNLQKLNEAGFEMDPQLKQILNSFFIDFSKISNKTVGDTFLDKKLRSFQKEAINLVSQLSGKGLIVLDTGCGKTPVAIGYMRLNPKKLPVLIIVLASLKLKWKNELLTWQKNKNIEIIQGQTPWKTTGDIVIANYDILHPRYEHEEDVDGNKEKYIIENTGWIEELQRRNFQLGILDESTAIKNPKANRTKAVYTICKDIPSQIHLTGTPIEHAPIEIYPSIQLIQPMLFPYKRNFEIKFCNAHQTRFGWDNKGHSNTKLLHNILKSTLMYRKLKQEILTELPPKVTSVIPIEIDNRQEYEKAQSNFLQYLQDTYGKSIANKRSNAETISMINELKQLAVKGKLKYIGEWIKDMLEVNDKIVVFIYHKFVTDYLLQQFKGKALKIDGSISTNVRKDGSTARDDVKHRFEHDPRINLLIVNFEAGGIGLDMQFAHEVAHLELMWGFSAHNQATARVWRMLQKETVNEYYLIAVNTIEEDFIAELIDTKRTVSDQIIDGKETPEESLLQKLIEKYSNGNI